MPISFTGVNMGGVIHGNTVDKQAVISDQRAASGNSRLKRWLSLKKINVAYRQSSSEIGASTPVQPSKLRRSAGVPLRNQRQSTSVNSSCDDNNNCSDVKRQPASADSALVPSSSLMPAGLPLLKIAEKAVGSRDPIPLLSLLHHRFSSPDLHGSRAPPPTTDEKSVLAANLVGLSELGEQANGKPDRKEPRPLPPRRKRSLIYAMYCTAKADDPTTPMPAQPETIAAIETDDVASVPHAPPSQQHRVPSWLCSLYSVDTVENISGTFMSCGSIQSAPSSPAASHANLPETVQSTAKHAASLQSNKISVEFVLMDTLSQQALALRNRKRASTVVSVAGSVDMMSCTSSNRSSCAEQSLMESAAYRCNSKCAPRLSTVERGQDGRLLLRPSDSQLPSLVTKDVTETVSNAARDLDSGNVSLKGDSPHQEALNLTAKPAITAESTIESPSHRFLKDVSVETFPPVPLVSPRNRHQTDSSRGPTDSLLLHASKFDASPISASSPSSLVCEQSSPVPNTIRGELSDTPDVIIPRLPEQPTPERRQMVISTPPDSPTRPIPAAAETSTDMTGAVSAGTIDLAHSPMSETKTHVHGIDMHTESEGSLSNTVNASKDDGAKLLGLDDGKPQWADPMHLPPLPTPTSAMEYTRSQPHLPVARARPGDSPCSLYSRFYNRSEESIGYSRACGVSRDSRVLSIFSDMSDCDIPPLDLAHAPLNQEGRLYNPHLSMLFDGQYGDSADFNANPPLVMTSADVETRDSVPSGSGESKDEDNTTLFNIAAITGAIISPRPPQPLPSTIQPEIAAEEASAADMMDDTPPPIVMPTSNSGPDNQANSFSARTRKLTAALVRGTPLDGLRNLHRKIKPASQRSSNGSTGSGDDRDVAAQQLLNDDVHQPKAFRFNELVAVYETWDRDEYDRKGFPSIRLDAALIEEIKQELNEYKVYEMLVHDESRGNTHFIY
ncbi:hypothetical protein GGH92_003514 [Coemansia sp. RSA 2673]|nr:hypothetical protein GGI14_001157 [Coemansia sp. S680]KAJ2346631.1 hypothetical protein GGH92_003514 [Coemansia sp. RSA 2673]